MMTQRQLTDKHLRAYEIGLTYDMPLHRAWEAEMYGPDRVEAFAAIEAACFEAGVLGHDLPTYVTGWRYGNIPETGYSRNHRDGYQEKGVSLMQVDGEDNATDGSFELFNGHRPRVRVSGFLLGFRGSDGEPLVIGARVMPEEQSCAA